MLEIRNLSAGYGRKSVINQISLSAHKGSITGIIGPNGSGKTTLMKAVVRVADVYNGSLLFDGEDITALSDSDRAKKIAYLPQNKSIPDMTVEHMVLSGRFPYLDYPRRYGKSDRDAADRAISRLGLEDIRNDFVSNLSGGQRQQAYIAMALAQDTPVVMLDEPTAFLDISHQLRLCGIIRELASMGKSVIIILHDLSLALSLCDKLYVMEKGSIAFSGTGEEVYKSCIAERVFGVKLSKITSDGIDYYICSSV